MTTPLKPCPLCGGKAEVDCSGWQWMHAQWVSCTKCGATGPMVEADDYTIIKTEAQLAAIAARKWNRRAPNAKAKRAAHRSRCGARDVNGSA